MEHLSQILLGQLRDSFYEDAGRFIRQLREEREHVAARADDPFDSPDVRRLTDEIETAEQTVEAIYERRIGKVVKQASLEAAGMAADAEGLTTEERDAFNRIVSTIEENRDHVLSVLATDREQNTQDAQNEPEQERSTETPPNGDPGAVDAPPTGPTAADVMGDGGDTLTDASSQSVPPDVPPDTDSHDVPVHEHDPESTSEPTSRTVTENGTATDESPQIDRAMVRITREVGQILCIDEREYDLSKNDVVTLPEINVGPLLERDAAERLE